MVYLSVLSFIASYLYLHIGIRTFKSNRKSEVYFAFFLLTLSMTIWSFADGFIYLAENVYEYSFWNKIAAFGWCTFEAISLYFTLTLTGNSKIKRWYIRMIIMMPALICLFMVLFLFGPDIDTAPWISNLFDIGNFIYNSIYLAASILLLYLWGARTNSRIQKIQAKIIVISCIIPFLLNLIVQHVLPYFHIITLPNMGQIFTLIMLIGVNYAIVKYQFIFVPTVDLADELFRELTGLAFLTDTQGYILRTNRQSCELLERKRVDIIGLHISDIFDEDRINRMIRDNDVIHERVRLTDITIATRSGELIPFHITVIPLQTKTGLLRGYLILGEDIRTTKWLEEEIERHKQTNERLYNSELLFRKLLEVTPIAILLINKETGNIIYSNSQAMELLGSNSEVLKGKNISLFIQNLSDRDVLAVGLNESQIAKKNEILIHKSDGTEFVGMITATTSIYHEEDVIVACVVDMTEQKLVEETLIKNNEYINQLNKELTNMNNKLVNKSNRDGLTNLYNHQYMNEILDLKVQEVSKTEKKLCLMMLDIDHFKEVNDHYGHQVGDMVLSKVAELIVMNTRAGDYIGRYGGEEFIAILPDTDLDTAANIAQNIRNSIYCSDYGIDDLKVTISIGVAQCIKENVNELINKADTLLYKAKANGRDRVEKH